MYILFHRYLYVAFLHQHASTILESPTTMISNLDIYNVEEIIALALDYIRLVPPPPPPSGCHLTMLQPYRVDYWAPSDLTLLQQLQLHSNTIPLSPTPSSFQDPSTWPLAVVAVGQCVMLPPRKRNVWVSLVAVVIVLLVLLGKGMPMMKLGNTSSTRRTHKKSRVVNLTAMEHDRVNKLFQQRVKKLQQQMVTTKNETIVTKGIKKISPKRVITKLLSLFPTKKESGSTIRPKVLTKQNHGLLFKVKWMLQKQKEAPIQQQQAIKKENHGLLFKLKWMLQKQREATIQQEQVFKKENHGLLFKLMQMLQKKETPVQGQQEVNKANHGLFFKLKLILQKKMQQGLSKAKNQSYSRQ